MDQLLKSNTLITNFMFDETTPFVNKTVTDTMKKLLSPFRASGHVTKYLTVTKDKIAVQVNDDKFEVIWNDVMHHFYVGISSGHMIDGYLYIPENETKKKTVQVLRDIFGMFRAKLDFDKKMAELDKKYPNFFTTF